jgi:hypothetical protein
MYLPAVAVVTAGLALLLTGCGGAGGGGVTIGGVVGIFLAGTPTVGLAEVHVHLTQVDTVNSAGDAVTLLTDSQLPDDLDLLTLAQRPRLLGAAVVAPGTYTQVRLTLSTVPGQNWVKTTSGAVHNLTLPGGPETSAHLLSGNLVVTSGGFTTLLLDFIVPASVLPAAPGGQWTLRPLLLGAVENSKSPVIGTVSGTVLTPAGHPLVPPAGEALGVFLQTSAGPVLATEVSAVEGSYTIPSLAAGTYTILLSYATPDGVPVGTPLNFQLNGGATASSAPITVVAGETLTADLVVPSA